MNDHLCGYYRMRIITKDKLSYIMGVDVIALKLNTNIKIMICHGCQSHHTGIKGDESEYDSPWIVRLSDEKCT